MSVPPATAGHTATRQWQNGAWHPLAENTVREIRLVVEHDGLCRGLWSRPQELEDLALGNALLEHPACVAGDSPVPLPAPDGVHVEQRSVDHEGITDNHVCVSINGPRRAQSDDAEPGSIAAGPLLEIMRTFLSAPGLQAGTGCFHRMGLLQLARNGEQAQLMHMVEDIGRHNCLDRLLGYAVRHGLTPGEYALLLSARVTASLYTKARRAGFVFLAGRAAVTKASFARAKEQGITLVGFCRPEDGRLTVFTDARQRVV